MTNTLSNKRRPKPNCFSKWKMRFKRTKNVTNEYNSRSIFSRVFLISAILLGIAPPIGRPPELKPSRRKPTRSIPPEYRVMSFEDAVRRLRSPTRANIRVLEAAGRIKVYAPLASDFVDHCVRVDDWSELSRCLIAENEEQTIMKLNLASRAWSSSRDDDHSPTPAGTELQR